MRTPKTKEMKTKRLLAISLCLSVLSFSYGQITDTPTEENSSTINLLDAQTKVLTDVFGDDFNGNHTGEVTGYLDLIEKMDATPEQKQDLRDKYKIYSLSLDPSKKDSLKLLFNKKLQEAMEEPVGE